ncbi:MAG: hypothetical protein RLZZ453_867 [Chlamydiota bacterium]|jgi:hypothetical protein
MTIVTSYNTCESLALQSPDLEKPNLCNPAAGHYFFPNEWHPRTISPHYAPQKGGIHITTGGERFFFNAITCTNPRHFFLNIDIDSHIKAYVDINILFLVISNSQEEYIDLIEKNNNCEIYNKINESTHLSETWKSYYLKNLTGYSNIYYRHKIHFINCKGCNPFISYHLPQEKRAFDTLQHLAREGKLLSICHSITDLTFINWQEIAEIDTSNIENYSPLHFRFASIPTSPIRIIRTPALGPSTRFVSWLYTPLTEEKREELQTLKNRVFQASKTSYTQGEFIAFISRTRMQNNTEPATNSPSRMSDCISALPLWEQFVKTHLIGNQQLGEFLCIQQYFDVDRFKRIPIETITRYVVINYPLSTQAAGLLISIHPDLHKVLIPKRLGTATSISDSSK